MNCSTMAAVPRFSWMNWTRRASCSSFSTTDACEMPADASKNSDLTISGKCRRFGERGLAPAPDDGEVGHRDAVIGEELLRQRLVARQDQAARIAAGVGQAQQLEVADDVLVERRDAGERLHQVEDDVRLERCHAGGRMPRRSSWTPRTRTSWPISRSVSMTSYSIFHSASRTSMPVVSSGGTRWSWTSARMRSLLHRNSRWPPLWR